MHTNVGAVANTGTVTLDGDYILVANAVIAAVSSTGTICLFARGPIELIVDINGWFVTAA